MFTANRGQAHASIYYRSTEAHRGIKNYPFPTAASSSKIYGVSVSEARAIRQMYRIEQTTHRGITQYLLPTAIPSSKIFAVSYARAIRHKYRIAQTPHRSIKKYSPHGNILELDFHASVPNVKKVAKPGACVRRMEPMYHRKLIAVSLNISASQCDILVLLSVTARQSTSQQRR